MEAKQYFSGEWRPLKAELSGHYVRRKEDVTFPRSEEQIDARLRELLAQATRPEVLELLEERRNLALRRSLIDWCRHCGFEPAAHHRLLIEELEKVRRDAALGGSCRPARPSRPTPAADANIIVGREFGGPTVVKYAAVHFNCPTGNCPSSKFLRHRAVQNKGGSGSSG
jgi:hypothetical protein